MQRGIVIALVVVSVLLGAALLRLTQIRMQSGPEIVATPASAPATASTPAAAGEARTASVSPAAGAVAAGVLPEPATPTDTPGEALEVPALPAQPAPPAAPDPALEAARAVERGLLAGLPDKRAALTAAFSDSGFASLQAALAVQNTHDPGARELSQLIAEQVRVKLPASGVIQLELLRCGVRICAASFLSKSRMAKLPKLGPSSVGFGTPLADGAVRHRFIFSLDNTLQLAPRPPSTP